MFAYSIPFTQNIVNNMKKLSKIEDSYICSYFMLVSVNKRPFSTRLSIRINNCKSIDDTDRPVIKSSRVSRKRPITVSSSLIARFNWFVCEKTFFTIIHTTSNDSILSMKSSFRFVPQKKNISVVSSPEINSIVQLATMSVGKFILIKVFSN